MSTDHDIDRELAAFDDADAASAHGLRAQLAEHGYALIDLGESADCAEADAFAAAERLFAEIERSEVVRAATTSELDPARRGYAGPLTENFASLAGQAAANDHVRKFRVGPDAGAAHAAATGTERYAAHYIPTPWPPPGAAFSFQAAATALYRRLERTAASCCALLESAFDSAGVSPLPPSHTSILSVNLCRMNDDELRRRREQGAASSIHEHTDVSLFTLVLVQPAIDCQGGARRGLEVCRPSDGVWAAVSPPANSLVLLVGDLLEFWSRGAVKASLHRVALPLSSEESRVSFVFFVSPAPDTPVGDGALTYDKWRKQRIRRAIRALKDGRRVADGGGEGRRSSAS